MVMGEVENTVLFPASMVQLSVESDGCTSFVVHRESCRGSIVWCFFCFALHVALKNENEKGDLDYEQEIFRTGRIIPQRENR